MHPKKFRLVAKLAACSLTSHFRLRVALFEALCSDWTGATVEKLLNIHTWRLTLTKRGVICEPNRAILS
jgi:hypothetical protein